CHPRRPPMTLLARGSAALLRTLVVAATLLMAARAADAPPSGPGIVAGDEKPAVDGPVVRIPGGWMVPYDETIPALGGDPVTFRMIPVPGGTFRMGSAADEAGRSIDEGPTFEVVVRPLWVGRCEVTWGEFKAYMGTCEIFGKMQRAGIRPVTPDNQIDAVTAPSVLYDPSTTFTNGEDDDLPAATMSQFTARQYTKWLSGLTGRFYRIPSEAEWEHACRGGTQTPWSVGADALADVAWFADNADDTTHAVGGKRPNAFGLHDMHGNVAEWVVDELVAGGYAKPAALPQPVAAAAAIQWPERLYPRVVRGGAYADEATECRSAARRGSVDDGGTEDDPDWRQEDPNLPRSPWWYTEAPALGVGMRVVRPLDEMDAAGRQRWWNADVESISDHVRRRLDVDGKGSEGIVDPTLPEELRARGIIE
ncbi:MAG: formylglycine-generating enzyme family protein, partial [Planctomycetaceae bacterium]